MNNQREIIETLYQEYTDASHSRYVRMIENLLEIVGERLNSSDIHFVAELIQNAEDAGFNLPIPYVTLQFLIEPTRIVVQNDARPFNEDDTRAICEAAASSKRHEENQIGFMGIGFKSVFKITEAPEIHSNGFHFRIRRYIYPEWIDTPPPLPDESMQNAFVIPLKAGLEIENLAQGFDNLEPSLLLFLQKLKCIEIDNRVTRRHQLIKAESDANGVVTLTSSQPTERWQTATFNLPESIVQVCVEKRLKSVQQPGRMTLQIACAIDEKGRFKRLTNSRFFAFLPTEQTTGLGFHLQADFVPTASRENIDQDRTDNRLILEFAGRCLVERVCQWRDEGTHDIDLYELLPLENEAAGIDALVVDQTRLQAAKERLVFTRSSEWHYPDDATYLPKPYRPLLDLLTTADLTRHFKRPVDFIHESITGRSREVVESLGVATFELKNLIEILEDKEWLTQRLPDYEWFTSLFSFLYGIREEIEKKGFLERLKSLLIVPAQSGHLAAPEVRDSDQAIYLPVKDETETSHKLFGSRLNLVSQDLLKAAETLGNNETVLDFLHWVGIEAVEPCWAISNIILPLFEEDDWQNLDEGLHFEYLDFVRRHWQEYLKQTHQSTSKSAVKKRAAEALRFKCHSEPDKYSLISQLILSKAYKVNDSLEAILSRVPDMYLISSCYAEHEEEAKKRQAFTGTSWCNLLCDLGILQLSSTERIISLLENTNWLSQKTSEEFCDLFIFFFSTQKSATEENIDLFEKLKSIPLVPVTSITQLRPAGGGSLLEASEHVYLPITDEIEASYKLFGQRLSLIARNLWDKIIDKTHKSHTIWVWPNENFN